MNLNKTKTFAGAIAALLIFTLMIGCGGSPSSKVPPTTAGAQEPLDPQGNWLITFTNPTNFHNSSQTMELAGQLYELSPPVVTSNPLGEIQLSPIGGGVCPGSFTFNGQASGVATIDLTGQQTATSGNLSKMTLTGTIATDQAHMSGTWTTATAGDCLRASDQGTWTAQLLVPVTGNWSGSVLGNFVASQAELAVTASLTEVTDQTTEIMGQVTGTITLLGSPCFPTASTQTIAPWNPQTGPGVHGGETLLLTSTPDANGVSVDTAGIVSPDGTTFTTTFGFRIHGGACDGQQLTGSLTHQ